MRKVLKYIALSFVALITLGTHTQCTMEEGDVYGAFPYIEFSYTDTTVAKSQQETALAIKSNRTLNVTSDVSWVRCKIEGGFLVLNIDENILETNRTASITITTPNNTVTKNLIITQDASGELTITGDLVLESSEAIAQNTYTKTRGNLFVCAMSSITAKSANQAAYVTKLASTDVVTRFGDSLMYVKPSNISDNDIKVLDQDIHMIAKHGMGVINTQITKVPMVVTKNNGVIRLYLDYNKISELPSAEELSSLHLTELSLQNNKISDISALAGATELKYLNLGGNNIVDITPICSENSSLEEIVLDNNPGLYDINPLLSLTNTAKISIKGLPITPVQYQIFSEKYSGIAKFDTLGTNPQGSPLARISAMEAEGLSTDSFILKAKVEDNGASDISEYAFYMGEGKNIKDMEKIPATYSEADHTISATITEKSIDNHIYYFRGSATNRHGEGFGPLSYHGRIVSEGNVYITSLDQMEELYNSNTSHVNGSLFVGNIQNGDYGSGIKLELPDTTLYFENSNINDISKLGNLTHISNGIYIANTAITDIEILKNFEHASNIWVKRNNIHSIPDLGNISGLTSINLAQNSLSDLTPLTTLNHLEELYLGQDGEQYLETNNIGKLDGLEKLTNLRKLDLSGLPLHQWQVDALREKMPNCDIIFSSGNRTPLFPTVSNSNITFTDNGAILKGKIDNIGGSSIIESGFYFGKDLNNLQKLTVSQTSQETIEYEVEINDEDKYYYAAYAVNSLGETRADDFSSFTISITPLSYHGTANSYIVTNAGRYTINPHIIGNGAAGIIPGAGFHTDNENIEPVSAELTWEDKSNIISEVSYRAEHRDLIFTASGTEGNALVSARDESGNIVWSWHIWVTDQPIEQTYVNYQGMSYIVLDRNMGATRNNRGTGDEWKESVGVYYQWGRKDPLAIYLHNSSGSPMTIEQTIRENTRYIYSDNWDDMGNCQLWGNAKTIYDPCPLGYKVMPQIAWSGFTTTGSNSNRFEEFNIVGGWDNGFNFKCDPSGSITAWYPGTSWGHWSIDEPHTNHGWYWSSTKPSNEETPRFFEIRYDDEFNTHVGVNWGYPMGSAKPVRCAKDVGYIDMALPGVSISQITDITTSSAVVECVVNHTGGSDVTSRGLIISTSNNPTLEDNMQVYESGAGDGTFTITLENLDESTRYYLRAYAVNNDGMGYSQVKSFNTTHEGGAIDLSANGKANCYIVPNAYGDYKFNCTTKGNSDESIGTPASASILWETNNTSNAIEQGSVLTSATLDGDYVILSVPFDSKGGNALVAVKDAEGTILWSWHIWVTDYNPMATALIYPSGAKMMDRNLGALSTDTEDVLSFGLMYQWGRKDPFVGSGNKTNTRAFVSPQDAITYVESSDQYNNFNYTVANPTVFINNSTWNHTNKEITWWKGEEKTPYDPCPAGWRVPEGGQETNRGAWAYLSDNNTIRYPYAGMINGENLQQVGYSAECWSTTAYDHDWVRSFFQDYAQYMYRHDTHVSRGLSVRCVRDVDFRVMDVKQTTTTDTSVIVLVSADLGNANVTKGGVVWSTSDNNALLKERCEHIEINISEGDFFVTLTGLTPNTTYYIKGYIVGEGIKYSEGFTIKTAARGNSDGYTEDEYEW